MTRQYRQGDLLFEYVPAAPATAQPVQPEHGRLILARGEATGHHHSVPATVGTLSLEEGGVMYLTVDELTAVTHQEHAPIDLVPGVVRVTRQRECSIVDAMPRQVAD